ncbi:hypothetical protein FACS189431_3730 [Alphaproteobacteria bacterium]|nr:hypothetical protein FACS189431_3730 [Alphaproteobacteria bacterium]
MDKTIVKIALTGGPCSGKTTAKSTLEHHFSRLGWQVVFIDETATQLIHAGAGPNCLDDIVAFEQAFVELQLSKEEIVDKRARSMTNEKILIICDRGILDAKAYMNEPDFDKVLTENNLNEVSAMGRYAGVFHLVTAADGAEEFYTKSNNEARLENVSEAIAADQKVQNAWTGHVHFRRIDNSTDFAVKMKRLIDEVAHLLGEPTSIEIERKFVIKYPDIALLKSLPNCKANDILQVYLKTDDRDSEVRLRQRGANGNYVFTKTIKRQVNDSNFSRLETEKCLTPEEFTIELMQINPDLRPIRKTRYCLVYGGFYVEIDVYPWWTNKAICEVEILGESEEVTLPDFIEVIEEVTGNIAWSNRAFAGAFFPGRVI